ncbi:EhaG family protein [Methanobacterium sp.]|uniref:EhaG family protein n=1 Tax=Methanobacterium sp. TaxID=2164 RepID=UPI001DB03BFF|nr:EhaG family protein [Methanobacterium sp.]MBI4813743.1 EhaG family protein [Methanobacterium sp.]MDY9922425.1 EhaG family protein [Methanobacterium sp.]
MSASVLVPSVVSPIVVSLFIPAVFTGLIVGLIGLMAIAYQKNDLSALILTDIVGVGMLILVAAVGTDLAEALILPGLVVELAEILAISEILLSREMRKTGKTAELIPLPVSLDMEIMTTAPTFLAIILIAYGAFLTGFTGGAVAGGGILFYVLSKRVRGVPADTWEGIAGISGIAWCLWLVGFIIFFVFPQYWLLALFLAAFGVFIKVAFKAGLIGVIGREEFNKK